MKVTVLHRYLKDKKAKDATVTIKMPKKKTTAGVFCAEKDLDTNIATGTEIIDTIEDDVVHVCRGNEPYMRITSLNEDDLEYSYECYTSDSDAFEDPQRCKADEDCNSDGVHCGSSTAKVYLGTVSASAEDGIAATLDPTSQPTLDPTSQPTPAPTLDPTSQPTPAATPAPANPTPAPANPTAGQAGAGPSIALERCTILL